MDRNSPLYRNLQVIDIRPPFAKGITSLEAEAHVKTLPYKVGSQSIYLFVIFLSCQVRRRVKALKKLQLEATNLEAKFYEEVIILTNVEKPWQ